MDAARNNSLLKLGYEAINQIVKSTDTAKVRCKSCGTVFEANFAKLISGERKCACMRENARQLKLAANRVGLESVVKSKGGTLETVGALRLHDKWDFRCEKGHTWSAQGTSVKGGTWCPACSGSLKRSLVDLEKIALVRGGKLLSKEYRGVDATYEFTCNLGHHFANMFKKVEKGQWCPTCSKGSKSEEIARTTFEHLFKVPFRKVRPKWLRNSRGRIMEIDGYNDFLKIGFEYQGIQHFKHVGMYSTDIAQRIQDDELKFELCASQGIYLFYLTYEDSYEDFPKRIQEQARAFGIDVTKINFDADIDLSTAYVRDDRLLELQELLEPKNIRVLSTKWLTSDTKYALECLVCGHKWSAQGNMFFNSRRVAGCRLCALRSVAGANRGDLSDLVEFAERFGGSTLATEYVQRRWNYSWKCSKGHIFEGNFNNMKFRNEFCPNCEGRTVKTFVTEAEAIELFRSKHLELLDPYPGKLKFVRVRCLICDAQAKQRYVNLSEGMAPCKNCDFLKVSEQAVAVMRAAGVQPLEPYVNVSSKWLCQCLTCKNHVRPSYSNVKRGQGACVFCGHEKTRKKNRNLDS